MRFLPPATATVALLLLLAGCTVPDQTPSPSTPPAPVPAAFAFQDRLDVAAKPNSQVEAFVDVSADGRTILTCLHGFFQAPSPMFVSQDGGASFDRVTPRPEWGVGGDCEVALGDDGWWYFLLSTVAGATLVATGDGGKTFTANHVTALPVNGMADRPWIETVGSVLLLTYMSMSGVTPGQPGSVGVMRSTDHGATWSTPQTLGGIEADTLVVVGHPLVGPDGTVRIPMVRYTRGIGPLEGPCRFIFALSTDEGATWKEETVAEDTCRPGFNSFPTSVAVAGDGTLYWAYFVPGEQGTELVAITSRDAGAWSPPTTLVAGLTSYDIPWMDGRPDGTATLAFIANTTSQPRNGQLLALRLDASLPGLVAGQVDLGVNTGVEFLGLDHDAAGRAHITTTNGPQLQYVRESLGPTVGMGFQEHVHGS